MAEVAGVVLGAIPLVLYALDNYRRTREKARSFQNWQEIIETFATDIRIQKFAFEDTLARLGIESTEKTTMADVEAVLRISQPHRYLHLMRHIRAMDDTINELASDLYPDAQGPVRNLVDSQSLLTPSEGYVIAKGSLNLY